MTVSQMALHRASRFDPPGILSRPQASSASQLGAFPSASHNRNHEEANYYLCLVVGRARPEMDGLLPKINAIKWLASICVVLIGMDILGTQTALALIHLTKHNLTVTSVNMDSRTGSSSQICIFCHTPFRGDPQVPHWSRSEPAAAYITYNSLGTSGQVGAAAPIGSVSMLCLSCHDGVQAMNLFSVETQKSGKNSSMIRT